jgi:hypothetical protein
LEEFATPTESLEEIFENKELMPNVVLYPSHMSNFYDKVLHLDQTHLEEWLNKHGFKYHSLLMGKPRGGNYHWVDNHLVKATR